MKRALLALTLAAALPFTASAAEGISYNYVEAGYAKIDAKNKFADSDGWTIAGSYAFLPNFHVFGSYSKQETDSRNYVFGGNTFRTPSADVDRWNVGVGYNHELSKRVDLVTRIAYEQNKYDFGGGFGSDKFKGGFVEAGVRGSLAPNWEGYAFAGYQDFDNTRGYGDLAAVLSTTTVPPFITHRTLSMTTLMSASGSPSTAVMSAKYPGAICPRLFVIPRTSAALVVAVASAWAGVIPSLTNHPSSRVFCPNPVNTASDPIPSLTPALNARRAVSKFRARNESSAATCCAV